MENIPTHPETSFDEKHLEITKEPDLEQRNGEYNIDKVLTSSWMKVLETDVEPADSDSFIQYGGDSLCAAYLVSILKNTLYIEISPADLLKNQTFIQLKKLIQNASRIPKVCTLRYDELTLCLSSAQLRMVLIQSMSPDSSAYVETIAFRVDKTVDANKVVSALVKRHPILNSRIHRDSKTLEYSIKMEERNFEVTIKDLNAEVSGDFLKQTTPEIPVLDSDLMKARLVKANDHNALILHIHHVIIDDVTRGNIAKDLEDLIENRSREKVQVKNQDYFHYVQQEQADLRSSKCSIDVEFWKKYFHMRPTESCLAISPTSEAASFDIKSHKAKHLLQVIPTEITEMILDYCHTHGLTPFQYFMSCAVLVLQRYLAVDEVNLAIPVTTRTGHHAHTDGMFVNTVLARFPVDLTLTVQEHVATMVTHWLEVSRHSSYPFALVAKLIWEKHGMNLSTFCSVTFNYTIGNRKGNEINVFAKDAKMPLSLDVINDRESNQFMIIVEWADGLLEDGIVQRLSESFVQLCSRMHAEERKNLKAVQVLSTQEIDLLKMFSTNLKDASIHDNTTSSLPIHSHFANHAKQLPEKIAVAIEDRVLSYRELDERSSRIAYVLSQEVGHGRLRTHPVVMVARKHEDMIAAIFGVWKSGGHFLPVSQSNQSSLKSIINRSQPAAILTNLPIDSLKCLESIYKYPLFSIDDLIKNSQMMTDVNYPIVSSDDLAYIIQTSGSTGTPKQCKVSHKSLQIIANAWKNEYHMEEFNVNVLQWATFSFDVFIGDIVRALVCAPGQLTICPDERRLDVPYILQLVVMHQVTTAEMTPFFAQQLFENSQKDNDFSSLKVFILGSDVLQRQVYEKIKRRLRASQRLLNGYGMTEATIDSSFFEGDYIPPTRSDTVPIGKPLPGVGFHVLDSRSFLPCPVGAVGELYISGDVVAAGDVNMVEIPHLGFHALKTGDTACWLPSGDVELLGRNESMVKLRGFRISIAEIENKILEKVNGVQQACVVPMSNVSKAGLKVDFLCAFITTDAGYSESYLNRNAICSQLNGELPYYMLPDIVQILPTMPLSVNGKLDHTALPDVSELLQQSPAHSKSHQSSVIAGMLKEIFAEAIGLPNGGCVNEEMTFMEQGGHSLILVKFSTFLAQRTSFDVTIADIFSYPTVSALEEHINHKNDQYTPQSPRTTTVDAPEHKDIAITGIGLRLPGNIMSLPQLWEAMNTGHDFVADVSEGRLKDVLSCLSNENREIFSQAELFQGVFFDKIDQFDHKFFKISTAEAKLMTPEQRMFLQVATEALAESKDLSKVSESKIGVFVGSSEIGYSTLECPDDPTTTSGLCPGMIATRVAYQWNLKGPSLLIDTACSSSLMALKEACHSINRGECEGALVGGVYLLMYPSRTRVYGKHSTLSDDFRCNPFDNDANGIAVGEGIMSIYVEPLEVALREKKPVYGVVRGIASNNVGHGNQMGAPSATSQSEAIQNALRKARVLPSEITFVEGNAAGTQLGDKIELAGFCSVFKDTRQGEHDLLIGSIKSIFGHLGPAAGMLGVFKILASFLAKKIPPTINYKTPCPELVNSGMKIPSSTIPWLPSKCANTRIAGINSFGLTNTNCHAVIAEAPLLDPSEDAHQIENQNPYHLLVAGSNFANIKLQLHLHKIHISHSILRSETSNIAGLCLTVARRLKGFLDLHVHFAYRMVIKATNVTQLLQAIELAEAATRLEEMKKVAIERPDIDFCSPDYSDFSSMSAEVNAFLRYGKINIEELFHGESDIIPPVREVTIIVYSETRHWLDYYESSPMASMDVGKLLEERMQETSELVRNFPRVLRPSEDFKETLGTFCSVVIINLLKVIGLGSYLSSDEEISLERAFVLSRILPKYERLFLAMVSELCQNGFLRATGVDTAIHNLDSFVFQCKSLRNVDVEDLENKAIGRYPLFADYFRLPLSCSDYLPSVLRGEMDPQSVIFPKEKFRTSCNVVDPFGEVYFTMYLQLIVFYVKELSKLGKKVRILEVCAGQGDITSRILPKLKKVPGVEYWFTDMEKTEVESSKTKFSQYSSQMKFTTLDIRDISQTTSSLPDSFDIILSCNGVSFTSSHMRSLRNLHSFLAEGGTLFLIERTKQKTWVILAWETLWDDNELQKNNPSMDEEYWERALQASGFQSVITCPHRDEEEDHADKFMFVCRRKAGRCSGNDYQDLSDGIVGRFDAENVHKLRESGKSVEYMFSSPAKVSAQQMVDETSITTKADFRKGTLLMFPGQGSQRIGMLAAMKDKLMAKKIFTLAEEILGYNVLDICLGDETILTERLKSTEFIQVAIFLSCLAKIEQMKIEEPEILQEVTHVAGLCIGELTALVYAEVLSFHDALKIASARGKAMERSMKETPTAMVSVIGPQRNQLEKFLEYNHPAILISAILGDNQHTVVGTHEECHNFIQTLESLPVEDNEEHMEVIHVKLVDAAGAFHSPYMEKATTEVNENIMGTTFCNPSLPIIMNVTGGIVNDPLEIKKYICQQSTKSIQWRQLIRTAHEVGVRKFLEVAPSRVLSSIIKKSMKEYKDCEIQFILV